MRHELRIALVSVAVGFAFPASAAVTLATSNGQLDTHIVSSTVGGAPQDATTVWGSTIAGGGSHDVDFTSGALLHISPGAGFASISDPTGDGNITALIINPLDGFNFSAIDFSVQGYEDTYFFVQYMLAGGATWLTPSGLGDPFLQAANELNDYLISADAGEVLGAIRISTCSSAATCTLDGLTGTGAGIKLEKQNSITLAAVIPPVPEPSTWAMMLLGFGAMGVSMRHRRRTHNLLQAA